jgi:hypothetical protein
MFLVRKVLFFQLSHRADRATFAMQVATGEVSMWNDWRCVKRNAARRTRRLPWKKCRGRGHDARCLKSPRHSRSRLRVLASRLGGRRQLRRRILSRSISLVAAGFAPKLFLWEASPTPITRSCGKIAMFAFQTRGQRRFPQSFGVKQIAAPARAIEATSVSHESTFSNNAETRDFDSRR